MWRWLQKRADFHFVSAAHVLFSNNSKPAIEHARFAFCSHLRLASYALLVSLQVGDLYKQVAIAMSLCALDEIYDLLRGVALFSAWIHTPAQEKVRYRVRCGNVLCWSLQPRVQWLARTFYFQHRLETGSSDFRTSQAKALR